MTSESVAGTVNNASGGEQKGKSTTTTRKRSVHQATSELAIWKSFFAVIYLVQLHNPINNFYVQLGLVIRLNNMVRSKRQV